MRQRRPEPSPAMTFDEASMERSKSFVKALQELKNLRPQLYSAADYCERSYLHNQQKQMVLDNLKDYTVRALVNAVDHLGTIAYKLTDLFEQQVLDVSTVEFKISCLNQQVLTCQTYLDKEGLSQQQMSAPMPKHHKHYILPIAKVDSVGPKAHRTRLSPTDDKQNRIQAKPRPHPPGTPASRTLSWHLASETNSAPDGVMKASTRQ
ncbi:protein ABIL1 isoform X1 [Iris pallida]|uniref:Protein ABIL1 isoform X1 n=1 Tax=Iris pallida TaxID=29817 RepID=A0AAX6IMA4_IRIPA|nr:protein ABIL1 isoform X1 [Iris pallida]